MNKFVFAFLLVLVALFFATQSNTAPFTRPLTWSEIQGTPSISQPFSAGSFDFLTPTTLSPADAGVTLNFSSNNRVASITLTGNVTFATSSLVAGKRYELRISNSQSTNCTFTFPATWKFIGIKPSYQTAAKNGRLSLESWSTTDADVLAYYGEEP